MEIISFFYNIIFQLLLGLGLSFSVTSALTSVSLVAIALGLLLIVPEFFFIAAILLLLAHFSR